MTATDAKEDVEEEEEIIDDNSADLINDFQYNSYCDK